MIVGYEQIKKIIEEHNFMQMNSDHFHRKTVLLEGAIRKSVCEKAEKILGIQAKVHVALSGGVDSSTLLMMMSDAKIPVVAHTIACNDRHPDVYYSRILTSLLKTDHMIHINKFDDGMSMYEALFRELSDHTRTIMCGDCIDELLGGYYAHMDPKRFSKNYDSSLNLRDNRRSTLINHMAMLVENHLYDQDRYSTKYHVDIYLPYADAQVFDSASNFSVNQLVYGSRRKKPMLAIAERIGVPNEIINRRKYGLVNAKDPIIYNHL